MTLVVWFLCSIEPPRYPDELRLKKEKKWSWAGLFVLEKINHDKSHDKINGSCIEVIEPLVSYRIETATMFGSSSPQIVTGAVWETSLEKNSQGETERSTVI